VFEALNCGRNPPQPGSYPGHLPRWRPRSYRIAALHSYALPHI